MTDDELTRLEALCAAATPGPWETDVWAFPDGEVIVQYETRASADSPPYKQWLLRMGSDLVDSRGHVMDDAYLIAEARTALPDLIAEVRRLREAVTAMGGKARGGMRSLTASGDVLTLLDAISATAEEVTG